MNLIEQLGGYEKAKLKAIELDFNLNNLEFLGGGSPRESMYERLDELEKALLQYRREHGVFEVGDKVFYTGRANDNDLYTLKETYDGHNFVVGSNGTDKDFWTLFIEEICHATDEEIKAGHRL
ncbi:hypothetical protein [Acinetobacter brisouii]|uniref:hypothetical protein n=1 Tax=Acinetobacter brisouii TaxID=396323 RepID=UPI0012503492|nr:hypothetical protein [Acinetobacter brisouii]